MMFPWEAAYGIGALALFGALIYGFWQYKNRNRANDRVTDEATRKLYQSPGDREYKADREALEREVRPS